MAIQINTQHFVPQTPDLRPVKSSGRKAYSTKPNANPAFVLSGPTPDAPEVYSPTQAAPDSHADLLAIHSQQQNAADYIMGALSGAGDLSGLRDPFSTIADGEVPQIVDPKGTAIDYLIGAIESSGSAGAGDIFSLALNATSQDAVLTGPTGWAGLTGRGHADGDVLAQMVLDAQQSNMDTLLNLRLGSGDSGADRGLADLN